MSFTYPINFGSVLTVSGDRPDSDNEEFGGFSGTVKITGISLLGRGGSLEVDEGLLCTLLDAAAAFLEGHATLDVDGDGYDGPFSSATQHTTSVTEVGGCS